MNKCTIHLTLGMTLFFEQGPHDSQCCHTVKGRVTTANSQAKHTLSNEAQNCRSFLTGLRWSCIFIQEDNFRVSITGGRKKKRYVIIPYHESSSNCMSLDEQSMAFLYQWGLIIDHGGRTRGSWIGGRMRHKTGNVVPPRRTAANYINGYHWQFIEWTWQPKPDNHVQPDWLQNQA